MNVTTRTLTAVGGIGQTTAEVMTTVKRDQFDFLRVGFGFCQSFV